MTATSTPLSAAPAPFARRAAAALLVLAPLTLLVGFTALTVSFDYPDVLRFPAADILARFAAGGPALVAQWYLMVLASLLFIPAGLLLHPLVARLSPALAPLASGLIAVGGLVNALGFLRWVFLVPGLAERAADASGSPSDAAREATTAVFAAFHAYSGVGVGEHLGFLFLAGWLAVTGRVLWRGGVFPAWLGVLWVVTALGTALGVLEPLGFGWAGPVNAIASSLAMVAVLIGGVFVARSRA